MNVSFDIEIKHPESGKNSHPGFIDSKNELKDFVVQKLSALKQEIELQEMIYKGAITICILDKPQWGLAFPRFTEELKEKMTNSFSPENQVYIQSKIAVMMGLF
ncbi:MAG: hypothetical protein Q8941_24675 [Bacteroidota bacterium]|nr:hypothetical protein [Bacteroidota bacterium]